MEFENNRDGMYTHIRLKVVCQYFKGDTASVAVNKAGHAEPFLKNDCYGLNNIFSKENYSVQNSWVDWFCIVVSWGYTHLPFTFRGRSPVRRRAHSTWNPSRARSWASSPHQLTSGTWSSAIITALQWSSDTVTVLEQPLSSITTSGWSSGITKASGQSHDIVATLGKLPGTCGYIIESTDFLFPSLYCHGFWVRFLHHWGFLATSSHRLGILSLICSDETEQGSLRWTSGIHAALR